MINSPQFKAHELKKKRIVSELKEAKKHKLGVALKKSTTNLFRDRQQDVQTKKIDVRVFNKVLHIDKKNRIATVEGMTTYEALVDETLKHGLMPAVVPELKSITIGGATSGVGLENSSFRYGFVHETIEEMEILLGDGRIVIANKTNNYKDLFFGFPNTYGTLGYLLSVKVKLVPVKKYVKIERKKYTSPVLLFQDLKNLSLQNRVNGTFDFIIAFAFSENDLYLELGTFVDEAPFVSDYTYMNIFYKSIPQKKLDYLTIRDYIWRLDTDWFWNSRHFFLENPLIRFLWGRKNLNSKAFMKVKDWSIRYGIRKVVERALYPNMEGIIQDVEVEVDRAAEFFSWLAKAVGIFPIAIGPTTVYDEKSHYTFFRLDPNKVNMNIGFYGFVKSDNAFGYYNKKIEQKVMQMGAQKMLYSDCFYSPEDFWRIYDKRAYDGLKRKYDNSGVLKGLYEKVVKRK